jgi:hypothetical protein
MAGVPMPFTIKYGGFTFPVDTQTTAISARDVWDAAGRTIIYVVYSITLKCYIQSDTGTDAKMQIAKIQLHKPAQPFTYVNTGGSNLRINTTAQRDVVWGPKPQVLNMRQVGGGNCWEIEWNVQVAIAELSAPPPFNRPMEYAYALAYSIDKSGYSRRTYSGFIRIPQTRPNPDARGLTDHADRYLEDIIPIPIPGFRRQPIERQIDESKCKLTFTVVDEEMPPNIPPPFVVECTASHSLESTNLSLISWGGTLTATYEMVKGVNPKLALKYFGNLFKDRVLDAKANSKALSVIPRKFAMSEPEIYGRNKATFSLSYIYTLGLADIVSAAGLWRPATDSDYKKWAASMKLAGVGEPRGLARLTFVSADDSIWDLGVDEGKKPVTPGNERLLNPALDQAIKDLFPLPPPPEKSWIQYRNQIHVVPNDEVAVQTALPSTLKTIGNFLLNPLAAGAAAGQAVANRGGKTVVQKRAQTGFYILMKGTAIRAGYPIPEPRLLTVAGIPAIPANNKEWGDGFLAATVGNWGVPLVKASWQMRYVLTDVPQKPIAQPPNPMLEVGDVKGEVAAIQDFHG